MVSGIFSFDFSILTENVLYFDQQIMKMMPIYSSTFGQMGMGIDWVAPRACPGFLRSGSAIWSEATGRATCFASETAFSVADRAMAVVRGRNPFGGFGGKASGGG